jgi:hypothetical protein
LLALSGLRTAYSFHYSNAQVNRTDHHFKPHQGDYLDSIHHTYCVQTLKFGLQFSQYRLTITPAADSIRNLTQEVHRGYKKQNTRDNRDYQSHNTNQGTDDRDHDVNEFDVKTGPFGSGVFLTTHNFFPAWCIGSLLDHYLIATLATAATMPI